MSSSNDRIDVAIVIKTEGIDDAVNGFSELNRVLRETKALSDAVSPSIKNVGDATKSVKMNDLTKGFNDFGESMVAVARHYPAINNFMKMISEIGNKNLNKVMDNLSLANIKDPSGAIKRIESSLTNAMKNIGGVTLPQTKIIMDFEKAFKDLSTNNNLGFANIRNFAKAYTDAGIELKTSGDVLSTTVLKFEDLGEAFGKSGLLTAKGFKSMQDNSIKLSGTLDKLGISWYDAFSIQPALLKQMQGNMTSTRLLTSLNEGLSTSVHNTASQQSALSRVAASMQVDVKNVAPVFKALSTAALGSNTSISDLLNKLQPYIGIANSAGISTDKFITSIGKSDTSFSNMAKNMTTITSVASRFGISGNDFVKLFPDTMTNFDKNINANTLYSNSLKQLRDEGFYTAENMVIIQRAADSLGISVDRLKNAFTSVTGSVSGAKSSFAQMTPILEEVKRFSDATGIPFDRFNTSLLDTPERIEKARYGMNTFSRAAIESGLGIDKAGQSFYNLAIKAGSGLDTTTDYMNINNQASMKLQSTYTQLGRQMFWVGLGTMFQMMSFDRLNTRQVQVERDVLQVIRAERSLQDQQDKLNETIAEFGPSSKEARDASADLKMKMYEQQLSQKELENAYRQTGMASAMFWVSTIGQATGMGSQAILLYQQLTLWNERYSFSKSRAAAQSVASSVTEASAANMVSNSAMQVAVSKTLEGAATDSVTAKNVASIGSYFSLAGAMNLVKVAGMQLAIGSLIMLPVALITLAWSNKIAADEMKKFEEQSKKMRSELGLLNGTGSGIGSGRKSSIRESITVWDMLGDSIKGAQEELKNAKISKDVNDLKFVLPGKTAGESLVLQNLSKNLAGQDLGLFGSSKTNRYTAGTTNININIKGNVDEKTVDDIGKKVKSTIINTNPFTGMVK